MYEVSFHLNTESEILIDQKTICLEGKKERVSVERNTHGS